MRRSGDSPLGEAAGDSLGDAPRLAITCSVVELHVSTKAMQGVKCGANDEETPPSPSEKLRTMGRSMRSTGNPGRSGAVFGRRSALVTVIAMSLSSGLAA